MLPLIEGGFAATLLAAAEGRLEAGLILRSTDATVGVVLAAEGYLGAPVTGATVHGWTAVRRCHRLFTQV